MAAVLFLPAGFGALPSGVHAAGVTLLTHGFNGNVTDWVIPMADRYLSHENFPGTSLSCYEIKITSAGTTAAFLKGSQPTATDSGEIFIKLNWPLLAGIFGANTTTVASRAVEALLSTELIPELGGRSLAEFPLHLAGHSRGGSVVSQMARLLGEQGIWVDHVTTWDPEPVELLQDDLTVTTYANVLYADNFWQDLGIGITQPNGQEVFGSYNRKLTELAGGYSLSHSDVHLWYPRHDRSLDTVHRHGHDWHGRDDYCHRTRDLVDCDRGSRRGGGQPLQLDRRWGSPQ